MDEQNIHGVVGKGSIPLRWFHPIQVQMFRVESLTVPSRMVSTVFGLQQVPTYSFSILFSSSFHSAALSIQLIILVRSQGIQSAHHSLMAATVQSQLVQQYMPLSRAFKVSVHSSCSTFNSTTCHSHPRLVQASSNISQLNSFGHLSAGHITTQLIPFNSRSTQLICASASSLYNHSSLAILNLSTVLFYAFHFMLPSFCSAQAQYLILLSVHKSNIYQAVFFIYRQLQLKNIGSQSYFNHLCSRFGRCYSQYSKIGRREGICPSIAVVVIFGQMLKHLWALIGEARILS